MHAPIDPLVGRCRDSGRHCLVVSCLSDLRGGQDHCFRAGLVSMSAALERTKVSVLLYDKVIIRQGNRITRPTSEPSSHAEGWGLA